MLGVLIPRVDQGGVTPAVSCQDDDARIDEDEPSQVQARPTVDVINSESGECVATGQV